MIDTYTELRKEISVLYKEVAALRETNSTLKKSLERATRENNELRAENRELMTFYRRTFLRNQNSLRRTLSMAERDAQKIFRKGDYK